MERYEFFVLPVAQVPPFDVDQPYVTEIDGVAMETYIDWMKSCYFISIVGNPAISVPCGFTPEGLPVGLQIVGAAPGRLGPAADGPRVRIRRSPEVRLKPEYPPLNGPGSGYSRTLRNSARVG